MAAHDTMQSTALFEADVRSTMQAKPMFSHEHNAEGFALAWSCQTVGALATGDCGGHLHTWAPREGGSWQVSAAYGGHPDSVEDVEWSPTEQTVLATACVDKVCHHWCGDTVVACAAAAAAAAACIAAGESGCQLFANIIPCVQPWMTHCLSCMQLREHDRCPNSKKMPASVDACSHPNRAHA